MFVTKLTNYFCVSGQIVKCHLLLHQPFRLALKVVHDILQAWL